MPQLRVNLGTKEFERVWLFASNHVPGYMRLNPRKPWSVDEKKEVIRLWIDSIGNTPNNSIG